MTLLKTYLNSLIATALIGMVAGLVAFGFNLGVSAIFFLGLKKASELHFLSFCFLAIFLSTSGALLCGFLMQRFAKEAAGSGIPEVKRKYLKNDTHYSWALIAVKFVAGIFSIGSGSSLGREGPTIHLGAALGSKISSFFKEEEGAKANAVCAGAAAGLAAAFHSPMAGMSLVLEEIAEGNNMNQYAGRCILASALSVATVYFLSGTLQEFPLPSNIPVSKSVFFLAPVIAFFSASIGLFFQWATLSLAKTFTKLSLPFWVKPAIGASLASLFCIVAFIATSKLGAFGLGEEDLIDGLNHKITWNAALWLLFMKLFATILCYSSFGCGGIFAPLIFFGGMSGIVIFGAAEMSIFGISLKAEDQTLFCLIGMTASISAVVRAPLTSILIVMEMAQQFSSLPALMLAAVIGSSLNALLFTDNFYNQTIKQRAHG